ncbi:hypothetical protein M0813_03454 [Anaeramoeba flamelloides]|uniref:4-alpha-glucanotransferase n=1 Tax=Anaeramoeba flamelloides TaxID=1746091 RepID=A0ABQ8XYN0_9EUKA|nr:hypothetical protein M0813_03454 [Anaeramoeba flamelloides]
MSSFKETTEKRTQQFKKTTNRETSIDKRAEDLHDRSINKREEKLTKNRNNFEENEITIEKTNQVIIHFQVSKVPEREKTCVSVLGNFNNYEPSSGLPLTKQSNGLWTGELIYDLAIEEPSFRYRYVLVPTLVDEKKRDELLKYEEDCHRKLNIRKENEEEKCVLLLNDSWNLKLSPEDFVQQTTPFYQVFYQGKRRRKRNLKTEEEVKNSLKWIDCCNSKKCGSKENEKEESVCVRFIVRALKVPLGKFVKIEITPSNLEEKDKEKEHFVKGKQMKPSHYSVWKTEIELQKRHFPIKYKYYIGIENQKEEEKDKDKDIIRDQTAERTLELSQNINYLVESDYNGFQYPEEIKKQMELWKIAGVCVPVFSLRTYDSCGVGEFLDLKKFADWAYDSHLHLIQILPINDSNVIANNETFEGENWHDSMPYTVLSSAALNPIFVNLNRLVNKEKQNQTENETESGLLERIEKKKQEFDKELDLNYPKVIKFKMEILEEIYSNLDKDEMLKEMDYFFHDNKHWLLSYALLRVLIEIKGTADRTQWDEYETITEEEVYKLTNANSKYYDRVLFFCWIQYHLSVQFTEAIEYLASKKIVLMGDLPIGVDFCSADVWLHPHLFRLNKLAGAHPDPGNLVGQNWFFPTYNWDEIAKDGYKWWRQRFGQMEKYMQSLRIDHILGFFRMWEVYPEQIQGNIGCFHKALPFSVEELKNFGIDNPEEWVEPIIQEECLNRDKFGNRYEQYLDQIENKAGYYKFKEQYDTQKKIKNSFNFKEIKEEKERQLQNDLMNELFELVSWFALLKDDNDPEKYHPRICIRYTKMYEQLPKNIRKIFREISRVYFGRRHDKYWEKIGREKISRIVDTTKMLLIAEDSGFRPKCVPRVLKQLNIPCMHVERMTRSSQTNFDVLEEYEYLSYAATSTHDIENLVLWWQENLKWERDEELAKIAKDKLLKERIEKGEVGSESSEDITSSDEDETETEKNTEENSIEIESEKVRKKKKKKSIVKPKRSVQYYHQNLGRTGEVPKYFDTDMAIVTIRRYLNSGSFLTVLPIQDWFSMRQELRRKPEEERINVPVNQTQQWRYRMQLKIEDLIKNQKQFTQSIATMVEKSNRLHY